MHCFYCWNQDIWETTNPAAPGLLIITDQPIFALPSNINLNECNTKNTASARLRNRFDFKKEDTIPEPIFSEIVWKTVKGEDLAMPAPRRSAFLKLKEEEDKEEEREKPVKKK